MKAEYPYLYLKTNKNSSFKNGFNELGTDLHLK